MRELIVPGMGQPMGAAPIQVAAPMNDVQLIAMLAVQLVPFFHKNYIAESEPTCAEKAVAYAGDILAETMRQHPANQRKLAEAVR